MSFFGHVMRKELGEFAMSRMGKEGRGRGRLKIKYMDGLKKINYVGSSLELQGTEKN